MALPKVRLECAPLGTHCERKTFRFGLNVPLHLQHIADEVIE
jgi:hypothetical protein